VVGILRVHGGSKATKNHRPAAQALDFVGDLEEALRQSSAAD
jgi:hypothetical protein